LDKQAELFRTPPKQKPALVSHADVQRIQPDRVKENITQEKALQDSLVESPEYVVIDATDSAKVYTVEVLPGSPKPANKVANDVEEVLNIKDDVPAVKSPIKITSPHKPSMVQLEEVRKLRSPQKAPSYNDLLNSGESRE
jgi:hypothetical protein